MKREALERVRCPRCGEPCQPTQIAREAGNDLVHAVVRCGCADYPIAEGILFLHRAESHRYVAELLLGAIRAGGEDSIRAAVAAACNANARDLLRALNLLHGSGARGRLETLIRRPLLELSSRRVERSLRDDARYGDLIHGPYFRYRFSSDSFWSIWPTLPWLGERPTCLVDAGCGHGHASFVISRLVRPEFHFCVDRKLSSLVLVRRFFAPQAQLIAMDLGGSLPFADRSVDAVFSIDSLHYVQPVRVTVSEFERVLGDAGRLLALHFHNALVYNPAAGDPLRWDLWMRLFNGWGARWIPEPALHQDFAAGRIAELERRYDDGSYAAANALALLAVPRGGRLESLEPAGWSPLDLPAHWSINPMYAVQADGTVLRLSRRPQPKDYATENEFAQRHLPERLELPAALQQELLALGEASLRKLPLERHSALEGWFRHGVLVPLPPRWQ